MRERGLGRGAEGGLAEVTSPPGDQAQVSIPTVPTGILSAPSQTRQVSKLQPRWLLYIITCR